MRFSKQKKNAPRKVFQPPLCLYFLCVLFSDNYFRHRRGVYIPFSGIPTRNNQRFLGTSDLTQSAFLPGKIRIGNLYFWFLLFRFVNYFLCVIFLLFLCHTITLLNCEGLYSTPKKNLADFLKKNFEEFSSEEDRSAGEEEEEDVEEICEFEGGGKEITPEKGVNGSEIISDNCTVHFSKS